MAKHDTDPVLGQLVHAVNESGQTGYRSQYLPTGRY